MPRLRVCSFQSTGELSDLFLLSRSSDRRLKVGDFQEEFSEHL